MVSVSVVVVMLSAGPEVSHPVVSRAVAAYAEGDYAQVVKLLDRALAAGIEPASARLEGRLTLAAAQFAMGNTDGATSALERLLGEQPGHPIDAAAYPPPFLRLVESVRARLAARVPAPVEPVAPATVATRVQPPDGVSKWWALGPGAVAVGAGVATGLLLRGANAQHLRLTGPLAGPSDVLLPAEASAIASNGAALQTGGFVTLGVALAAAVGALLLAWLGTAP